MARVITGMFPQPVQTDPASQSEPENSVTSDIGENVLFVMFLIVTLGFILHSESSQFNSNEVCLSVVQPSFIFTNLPMCLVKSTTQSIAHDINQQEWRAAPCSSL